MHVPGTSICYLHSCALQISNELSAWTWLHWTRDGIEFCQEHSNNIYDSKEEPTLVQHK